MLTLREINFFIMIIEPGNKMYGHYFVEDVCMYVRQDVRRKKLNMISASDISGVASHGKHTRATEHVKKLGIWQFCSI